MKKATRHQEPSAESLREMPELSPTAKGRPNPYAARIKREGYRVIVTRGRPKKGEEQGPTHPRSVRFPDSVWRQLEGAARAQGLTLHAALRTAVMEWMGKAAAK